MYYNVVVSYYLLVLLRSYIYIHMYIYTVVYYRRRRCLRHYRRIAAVINSLSLSGCDNIGFKERAPRSDKDLHN